MTTDPTREPAMIRSRDGSREVSPDDLDRMFNDGSDEVDAFVDRSRGQPIHSDGRWVTVELSELTVLRLDAEAANRGLHRRELIRRWIDERLDRGDA